MRSTKQYLELSLLSVHLNNYHSLPQSLECAYCKDSLYKTTYSTYPPLQGRWQRTIVVPYVATRPIQIFYLPREKILLSPLNKSPFYGILNQIFLSPCMRFSAQILSMLKKVMPEFWLDFLAATPPPPKWPFVPFECVGLAITWVGGGYFPYRVQ